MKLFLFYILSNFLFVYLLFITYTSAHHGFTWDKKVHGSLWGKWLSNFQKYIGGKSFALGDVDGDEFCFVDLNKDIEENVTLTDFRILWVKDGLWGWHQMM